MTDVLVCRTSADTLGDDALLPEVGVGEGKLYGVRVCLLGVDGLTIGKAAPVGFLRGVELGSYSPGLGAGAIISNLDLGADPDEAAMIEMGVLAGNAAVVNPRSIALG